MSERFSIEREVDMYSGRVVSIHLVDDYGILPRLVFTDPQDLYDYQKALEKELNKSMELLDDMISECNYNLKICEREGDMKGQERFISYRVALHNLKSRITGYGGEVWE